RRRAGRGKQRAVLEHAVPRAADILADRDADQPGAGERRPRLAAWVREDPRRQLGDRLLLVGVCEVHRAPHRGAPGMPRPIRAMMSRWISLVPPPNDRTSVVR